MIGCFVRNFYRASKDGETHYGHREEISRLVHVSDGALARASRRLNNVTNTGWTITRVRDEDIPDEYRHKLARQYIATKTGEDPIMGDAEEIALLIGVEKRSVERAYGSHRTIRGWEVKRASEAEIKQYESQWA